MAETKSVYPRSPVASEHNGMMIVTVVVGLLLAAAIVLFAHWLGSRSVGGAAPGETAPMERLGQSFP